MTAFLIGDRVRLTVALPIAEWVQDHESVLEVVYVPQVVPVGTTGTILKRPPPSPNNHDLIVVRFDYSGVRGASVDVWAPMSSLEKIET
jgi:hypothetical protein